MSDFLRSSARYSKYVITKQKKIETKLGFESKISGYIASHLTGPEAVAQIQIEIDKLPNLENDKWPFLPKDIFNISKPLTKEANPVQISYRSTMIHFSMSVKQIEDELKEWIGKFQSFFERIPGVYEANVDINLTPYTFDYTNGNLNYNWSRYNNPKTTNKWNFHGDPIELENICNTIKSLNTNLSKELKEQIILNLQWLGEQTNQLALITDKITTVKGNYNRHFTRTNEFEAIIRNFSVGTSGAIGKLEGEKFSFEFKTDCIERINRAKNELELELALDNNSSRLINIKLKAPGDNTV